MKLIKEGNIIELDEFDIDEIFNYTSKQAQFDANEIKDKCLTYYEEQLYGILMKLGIDPSPMHTKKLLKSHIVLPELKESKKTYKYEFKGFEDVFEYMMKMAHDDNFFPYRAK
jgi:hypothetical protein